MSGFVYLWYDRKHKRYYVGSHWGREDDGYVCSSKWMYTSWKRRPTDFKRRILARISTCKKDLIAEENKWLSMIKPEEVKIKYYNLNIKAWELWHMDEIRKGTVGQKIAESNRGRKQNFKDPVGRGQKISAAKKGVKCSDEHRAAMSASRKGRKQSPELKAKIAEGLKRAYAEGRRKINNDESSIETAAN